MLGMMTAQYDFWKRSVGTLLPSSVVISVKTLVASLMRCASVSAPNTAEEHINNTLTRKMLDIGIAPYKVLPNVKDEEPLYRAPFSLAPKLKRRRSNRLSAALLGVLGLGDLRRLNAGDFTFTKSIRYGTETRRGMARIVASAIGNLSNSTWRSVMNRQFWQFGRDRRVPAVGSSIKSSEKKMAALEPIVNARKK
jgi:hypothetical protein